MKKNIYTEEQLWRAVRILASHPKSIKERLAVAYDFHLSLVMSESMPTKEWQKKIEGIKERLTKKYTKPVSEAIYYWKLRDCQAAAAAICDAYDSYIHFNWAQTY